MKDIEWLKDEIKVFQEGENMFTAEFNAGVQQALEYMQELIDQLDEPEKPVIPQFVADWIKGKEKYTAFELFYEIDEDSISKWLYEGTQEESRAREIMLLQALDGEYETEKEKLYTVDLPHSYELIKLLHTQTYAIKKYSESGFGDYTNAFTEAEIKAIDERYWAFAEEVTE